MKLMSQVGVFLMYLLIQSSPLFAELVPNDSTQFYFAPKLSHTITFSVTDVKNREFEYIVQNYNSEQVTIGNAKLNESGNLVVELNLKQGYYEIIFPSTKQAFGFVAIPAYVGDIDSFWGMDVAMSWLGVPKDNAKRLERASILKWVGISVARERLSWKGMNPEPDKWIWPPQYKLTREAYQTAGIKVLDVFHDAPDWLDGLIQRYPRNLQKTFETWKLFLPQLTENWAGLELWNEPDIGFGGNLPADQYVPLIKTLSQTAMQSHASVPLVGGVFTDRAPSSFLSACAENGLFQNIEIVSFHSYREATGIEGLVAQYRSLLDKYQGSDLPMWITESGKSWNASFPRPPFREDASSAMDITMKSVESRACGIARYFPFAFCDYKEGNQNFGLVDRYFTPLRSMAAYSQAIKVLSGKSYLGDIKVADKLLSRARVFGDKKETVIVFYTGVIDASAYLNLNFKVQRVEGADGRELTASLPSKVPIGDGLIYVWIDPAELPDLITTDSRAMKLFKAVKMTARNEVPIKKIILQTNVELSQFDQVASTGYYLNADTCRSVSLGVKAINLGDVESSVVVRISLPEKSNLLEGKDAIPINIPAGSSQFISWKVDLSSSLKVDEILPISVSVEDADGHPIDKLVMTCGLAPKKPKVNIGRTSNLLSKTEAISLDRWQGIVPITANHLIKFEQSESDVRPNDLATKAKFTWNEEGLSFLFEVTDDVHYPIDGDLCWRGDSIQLAIHPMKANEARGVGYTTNDREFIIYYYHKKAHILRSYPKNDSMALSSNTFVKAERLESESRTIYEGQVAWEDLPGIAPKIDNQFALNFLVNDNDGKGRKGWIEWTSGIGGGKDTQAFGEATLVAW